jgi:hypothetical protein
MWPVVTAAAGAVVVIALLAISVAVMWSTRSQVRDVRRDLITSRDELRRTRTDLKQLQGQLGDAQSTIDDLDGVIGDLQQQIDDLDRRIGELERQVDAGGPTLDKPVAFGPTLGERLGNPVELATDGTLGAVIAGTDARCLLGDTGETAISAARTTPELTGRSASDVTEIVRRVESIRQESVDPDPRVEILSTDDFNALVQDDLGAIPADEVADEERVLELLGAVPRGYDLVAAYGDAPSGVAGFYDPSDSTVRVRRRDGTDGLGPLWEVVLAHEVDHAIDAKALGVPGEVAFDIDAAAAADAVREGDATLVMQLYASEHLGIPAELGALAEASRHIPSLDYPPYLRAQAQFSYVEGVRYLCYRLLQGGWSRVNREFTAPPTSTYAVLFPDRASPVVVRTSEVGAVPSGWRDSGTEAFGAANVMWLLQSPGADVTKALPGAREIAADWRGGTVDLFRRGSRYAVALRLGTATGALCGAMVDWYAAMRPGATRAGSGETVEFTELDQVALVRCTGDEVRVAIGPDARVARSLAD